MMDIGNQVEERDIEKARGLLNDALKQVFEALVATMKQRDEFAFKLQAISSDCQFLANNLNAELLSRDLGETLEFAVEELERMGATAVAARRGSFIRWSCATLIAEFMEANPPNYLAFPVHLDDGIYEVKITRPGGLDQHQLLRDRTEERNWLLGKFDLLRAWFDDHPGAGDEEVEEIFRLVGLMAENGGTA